MLIRHITNSPQDKLNPPGLCGENWIISHSIYSYGTAGYEYIKKVQLHIVLLRHRHKYVAWICSEVTPLKELLCSGANLI